MKPKRRCTSVVSGVPLLIGVEKKTWLISHFIIRLTHANVWESMWKPCSCTQFIKSRIFYYKSRENPYQYRKSHENPYQVLQVTRESVSGTTSHVRCVWTCNEIEGSYDKIIITIVPSYTGKNITRLLPLALLLVLRTRNNTDGNKLVIFSGIALYYGDNYIFSIEEINNRPGCYHSLYSTPRGLLDQPTCSSRGSPMFIADRIQSL